MVKQLKRAIKMMHYEFKGNPHFREMLVENYLFITECKFILYLKQTTCLIYVNNLLYSLENIFN